MAANTNGLIYYKLDIDKYGYSGDVTKNCGLRGEEVDSNFNFLRGQDIQNIEFDGNDNLIITKLNGEKLSAIKTPQPELPNYLFSFNNETGELIIIAPNGEKTVLSGFTPTINIYNYHDYTLKGSGTLESPLKVNETILTGCYKPAIKLIDTTVENNTLPTENVAKYDRYVTKERFSKFGKLYPLKGVELISKRLEEINSEWRVPTKQDWDTMLNTVDCYEPNHNDESANVFLGESAGAILKATSYWKKFNNEMLSDDNYGFSIYPVGYAGNRGKEYYGSFGESSAFWTMTEKTGNKDMFIKLFEYNSEKVGQHTWGENYYLSLRLVKDFKENNFNNTEIIDGSIVECVHIPETKLIWTKYNIGFTKEEYDGFSPVEWEQYENNQDDSIAYNMHYFINEWDGEKWEKCELCEGYGIVLKEGEFGKSHEWIVSNGILTDISVLINTDLRDDIISLNTRIDETSEELITTINEQIDIIDKKIATNIQDEVLKLTQSDENILEAVSSEKNRAENVENELEELIIKLEEDAHIHENFKLLNNINEATISRWNNSKLESVTESNAYTDKEISDLSDNVEMELFTVKTSAHTHTDYSALNRITNDKINEWDTIENRMQGYSNETFIRKDVAEVTYITYAHLSRLLKELSDRISVLEGKMEQTISYIEGTGGEITVSKSGNVATVSFDPNAEFEATFEEE